MRMQSGGKRNGLLPHRSGRGGQHLSAKFETCQIKTKGFPKPPSYRKASLDPINKNQLE